MMRLSFTGLPFALWARLGALLLFAATWSGTALAQDKPNPMAAADEPAPPDAPAIDPCESPELSQRIKCVGDLSRALAGVCDAEPAERVNELTSLKATNAAGDESILKPEVCNVLCPPPPPPRAVAAVVAAVADQVNICRMSEAQAGAAAVSAWPEVVAVREYVKAKLQQLTAKLDAKPEKDAKKPKLAALADAVSKKTAATSALPAPEEIAATFLQGLAKLIADRGKTEAVGWILDNLGRDLCGKNDTEMSLAQREIGAYWLPSVCALARGQRLSGYGGGGAMLEGLRRAIESDMEHWPGAAASLPVAELYFSDVPDKERPGSVVECDLASFASSPACTAIVAVRSATRSGVTDMLKGRDPLVALRDLSTAYAQANADAATVSYVSIKLQLAACALGLPEDLRQSHDGLETYFGSRAGERAHAGVLAGLVSVPACFEIVKAPATPARAIQLPRLDTQWRLEAKIAISVTEARLQLKVLADAIQELKAARDALEKASDKLLTLPAPALPNATNGASVLETLTAYQAGVANGILGPQQLRLLRAVIGVADAGAAAGQGSLGALFSVCDLNLAQDGYAGSIGKVCKQGVTDAQKRLRDLRRYITVASEVASGDWSKVSLSVLAAARVATPAAFGSSPTNDKLLRHIGLLVAIVSARDSDGVARALDQAAAPVGSWRGKGVPGATTLSIVSHPGLFGAVEWRHGTYGADFEDWAPHGQAPTLAMPVGFEVAWGTSCCVSPVGLFLPLIDPAAFLQYDAERDGKLPGASIKTALSPGLGLRLGFAGSPFSLIPQVVYRPGFRQWESKFSGTGADAIQLGLMLSVDVTLLQLSHTEKNE